MASRPSSTPPAAGAARSAATLPVHEALGRSEPLAALSARLRESAARFATIRPCLPPPLAPAVAPGPVDAEGWSLLVSSPAVSAKLRQLTPLLEAALREAGWPATTIRIKVQQQPR